MSSTDPKARPEFVEAARRHGWRLFKWSGLSYVLIFLTVGFSAVGVLNLPADGRGSMPLSIAMLAVAGLCLAGMAMVYFIKTRLPQTVECPTCHGAAEIRKVGGFFSHHTGADLVCEQCNQRANTGLTTGSSRPSLHGG